MDTLDIPEPQVLVHYPDDEGAPYWHHRVLVKRVMAGVWIAITPDLDLVRHNLLEQRHIVLDRNSMFPANHRRETYGFDPSRIAVSGGSAGGHLSLVAGILGSREGHACSPGEGFRVGAVVNWYGVTNIETADSYLVEAMPDDNYARSWAGDESRIADLSSRYSPILIVDEEAPPILTIHGEEDSVVPHEQAVSFHARLEELGVVHELRSMPGGTHVGFTEEQFQEAFTAIFAFLDEAGLQIR